MSMIEPAVSLQTHGEQSRAEDGVAQVFIGGGNDHAGMAVFVGGSKIVTCAHVVNLALRRSNKFDDTFPEPSDQVELVFHYFDEDGTFKSSERFKAWVAKWGLSEQPTIDLAVLSVIGALPSTLRSAVFTSLFQPGEEWTVYGQHDNDAQPQWSREKGSSISRPTGSNNTELQGGSGAGRWIEEGDSGGGVWCEARHALVGIIATTHEHSATNRIAEMLATDVVKNFWPPVRCDDPDRVPTGGVSIAELVFILAALLLFGLMAPWPSLHRSPAVSYTHLTLPTIYSV